MLKSLRAIFLMARPSHLLLIGFIYLLGATMAVAMGAQIDAKLLLAGLLALMPISMSVHYANEYADVDTDALTQRTPFSGGSGALPGSGLPRSLAALFRAGVPQPAGDNLAGSARRCCCGQIHIGDSLVGEKASKAILACGCWRFCIHPIAD